MDEKEKGKSNDPGLGLDSFLKGDSAPAKEPVEIKADETEKTKIAPAKVEPTPAKEPAKVAAKANEGGLPKGEDNKPGLLTKPEVKPGGGISIEPAAPNWDDDSNPWKKKADEFDKRYRDTHRDWNRLNQGNQDLQRQLAVLGKKVDGTYDATVDEPKGPTAAQARQQGETSGRAEASLASAFRAHGEDVVMTALQRYADIFGHDPSVQQRILASKDPVQGAMDAVKGFEFFEKYGNDPTAILTKAKAEFEAEHLPKLREAEAKRIMDEMAGKRGSGEPKGLSNVQGGSGEMDKTITKANAGRPKALGQLFNNF